MLLTGFTLDAQRRRGPKLIRGRWRASQITGRSKRNVKAQRNLIYLLVKCSESMEMLPPAPVPSNVVVGATVVKRFPGYGERRGTIAEIDLDGGKVVVRWATDESTISLGEAANAPYR